MSVLACLVAVACSGGVAESVNGPEGSGDGVATVSSVRMTPSSVAVEEGTTAYVSMTVTASDGTSLDREGSWEIEDASVAALSGVGATRQIEGLTTGSTRVAATVGSVADTTVIDVVAPSDPGDAEPTVVFDPDQYSSTRELMDDPYGVFSTPEIGEDPRDGERGGYIHLDTDVHRPDGGTHAMRYDYVDQGWSDSGEKNAFHVGRRIKLPKTREAWVRAQVRWSENFFQIQSFPDGGATYAHKLLFLLAKNLQRDKNWLTNDGQQVSRWAINWPGGGWSNPPKGAILMASPRRVDGTAGDEPPFGKFSDGVPLASDFFDGEWHEIRLHVRHNPGLFELWIDGLLFQRVEGFDIVPEAQITDLLLGRNKDNGIEGGTESLWWGRVEAYTEDPGWGR